ncbi:MAG: helix-turn-helix domain-containing protein [Chthoniobacterales bacterium]
MKEIEPFLFDWQALHVVLDRCYEGPPSGKSGTFQGTVLTVCHLLEGSVTMHKDGVTVDTCAGKKEWIVCIPGERTQHFSDNARIISIHLAVKSPENGAEWRGIPIVRFAPDRVASRAMTRLCGAKVIRRLTREQTLKIYGVLLSLPEMLEIQELTLAFLRNLLRIAALHKFRFEPPLIHDPRVRESHRSLSTIDLRERYLRQTFAAKYGLTAGQLDRLWRHELGMTPRQYHECRRVAFASEQLRRQGTSVKCIAVDLGFRHLSQFSNWFSAHQNESPRQFQTRPESN